MKNVFAWLRRQFSHLQISLLVGMLILMGFGSAIRPAMAQNPSNEEPGHARGIPSRAERVAEETVSLSAEQIIEVLRREPGLLLAVKKALVREAYAEGRVLDTADLEDEPLYRWLREDGRVRVLATREIEVRRYVRPKPTPEEETQGESERQSGGLGLAVLPSGQGAADTRGDILGRQEEIYWRKHDYSQSNGGMAAPALEPESQPRQNSTESRPVNPARSLTQAELGDQLPANGFISNLRLSDPQVSGQRPAGEDDIDANSLERIVSPYSAMVPVSNLLNSTAAVDQARSSMVNPNVSSFADTNTLAASIPGGKNAEFEFSAGRQPGNGRNQMVFPGMHGSRSDSPMEPERAAIRHRANPYANVPSLYDLYTQVAGRAPVLERFGMDVFRNPNNNLDSLPMDLPVGPDYVVGPGDGLNIQLSGSVAQRLVRVVDPEGRVALPEVGAIEVSGRNLGEVQHLVQASLRTEFHDVRADVALGRIRTIRVYVVGDVESPGAYDISSLSSVLNALYAAAGPTARGSLRHLRQYRGKTLVQEIDAYDLLLHGIHSELARLQSGDTLLVPPLGPEVTVQGMVQRPAIYELADEKNLAEILELAGGVLSSGSLRHVDVERTVAHQSRTMLRLDLPEGKLYGFSMWTTVLRLFQWRTFPPERVWDRQAVIWSGY